MGRRPRGTGHAAHGAVGLELWGAEGTEPQAGVSPGAKVCAKAPGKPAARAD